MAIITPDNSSKDGKKTIRVKTKSDKNMPMQGYKWWNASSKKDLSNQMLATAGFLKEQQQYRYRQAALNCRLYGNMPLMNFVGSQFNRMSISGSLPIDRPTMNVVQSCIDTLVSRITQSRPQPRFLTDNSDYKERNLAKQLNQFVLGEFYQTKAYELAALVLRDAAVLGTGILKNYETEDKRVGLDRVLEPELLVDPNDAFYGNPRQLFHMKLIDRDVALEMFPKNPGMVENAESAYPDNSGDSARSVSDQIMIVEGWHLRSGKDASDGVHAIACTEGILSDPEFKKDKFPFTFMHYSPRLLGFWGQGLSEQLTGTQVEINKLLSTISASINLVGVPRVFVEDGSKVVKAHLNNQIGAIVTYRGTKPQYEVAPCVPQEMYAQLQRLVEYAYQQSGISALAATSQKPAGLNSGEAIRNYDDLQSDRFAALNRRYDNFFIELAYQITDMARDICERDGKYQTIYPNKNGTKQIDLPGAKLLDNPFVIQCFNSSSLPRDPSGRLAKITEMMQAGIISLQEGRRLLDYPDLEQTEKLANSSEERIFQTLDEIVDKGKYTPPDPFMDLKLAKQLVTQYYNLYVPAKLEESRAQLLRDFSTQIDTIMMAATTPPPQDPMAAGAAPIGVPEAPPVSQMLPV